MSTDSTVINYFTLNPDNSVFVKLRGSVSFRKYMCNLHIGVLQGKLNVAYDRMQNHNQKETGT